MNNPNYKQEHTEDDGYIDTNTYEEPSSDLYEICDTPNYGIIDEATQQPETMYDLGSNNNEFYDNITEN